MQAKEIFLQAIDVEDAAERNVFVDAMCGDDAALKRKVLALLAANEEPESFLDQPAARFDVTATAFGKTNGNGLLDSSHHGRFLPGTKLADRYRIVSMLGRGGMGEVYRADDLRLGQTVALKFLPRDLAKDPKRLEYFHQEVKLARQISHPNICRVYDIGEVNGQQFLSMEYIDGEDLKTLLRRIGRLPKDKGIQIARQLCSGLAAAHAKGVLHRDLKPANIMIDGQGQVRITDFGLATVSADGENVIGMSGTPAYMAPEQLLRGQTNARTDIYSLGLILFEVFTGKPAHDASSLPELQRLHEDSSNALNPSDIVDDMDPAVERAISRCLASDPSMRPRTASELAAALPGGDPLAAALAAGETPHPDIVAMSGDISTLRVRTAAALVVAIIAALLVQLAGRQKLSYLNDLEPFLSPEVLTYRAQNILKQLGPDIQSHDFSFGFDAEEAQEINHAIARRTGFENWTRMGFWYRESPEEFRSDTLGLDYQRSGTSAVDLWYPSWSISGMRGVRLDNAGLLRWFQAVPPKKFRDEAVVKPINWSQWFTEEMIGFRLDELEPIETQVVPPVVYDEVRSWNGTWPSSDHPLIVSAAAFQGRPVYFEILAHASERMHEPALPQTVRAGLAIGHIIKSTMLLVALGMVVRNLYLRRWDRRGAWRLVKVTAVAIVFANLTIAHHTWSDWEIAVLINCCASSLVGSAQFWVSYVALEPTVRRYWPELLVSWTRLLSGRITDARIGRDILVGSLVGISSGVLFMLTIRLLHPDHQSLYDRHSLMGLNYFLGRVPRLAIGSVSLMFTATFVMVVLRILLRGKTPAIIFLLVLYGTIQSLTNSVPMFAWIIVWLQVGMFLFVLVQNGLLAAILALFVYGLMGSAITLDPSRFYYWDSMICIGFILCLASFGLLSALGGWQRLIRRQPVGW